MKTQQRWMKGATGEGAARPDTTEYGNVPHLQVRILPLAPKHTEHTYEIGNS